MKKSFSSAVTLSAFIISIALPATAETQSIKITTTPQATSAPATLPGVKPAKPIVTPVEAEPADTLVQTNPDGSFMVGNTRVKISGTVTVDIGKGAIRDK